MFVHLDSSFFQAFLRCKIVQFVSVVFEGDAVAVGEDFAGAVYVEARWWWVAFDWRLLSLGFLDGFARNVLTAGHWHWTRTPYLYLNKKKARARATAEKLEALRLRGKPVSRDMSPVVRSFQQLSVCLEFVIQARQRLGWIPTGFIQGANLSNSNDQSELPQTSAVVPVRVMRKAI